MKVVKESEKFFHDQWFLLKFAGLMFDYEKNWKDLLMRILSYYTVIAIFVTMTLELFYISQQREHFENVSECIGSVISYMEMMVKYSVFKLKKDQLKNLIKDLMEIEKNEMTQESSSRLQISGNDNFTNELRKKTRKLNIFTASTFLTVLASIFKSIRRNFAELHRTFPIKIR